jgi:hypothetical protein
MELLVIDESGDNGLAEVALNFTFCRREYLTAYETYLLEKTSKTQCPQTALIYFDFNPSQEKHVRQIVREYSRKFDRQTRFPSAGIVEGVIFRDSTASYFIQLADMLAFSINRIVTEKVSTMLLQSTQLTFF